MVERQVQQVDLTGNVRPSAAGECDVSMSLVGLVCASRIGEGEGWVIVLSFVLVIVQTVVPPSLI